MNEAELYQRVVYHVSQTMHAHEFGGTIRRWITQSYLFQVAWILLGVLHLSLVVFVDDSPWFAVINSILFGFCAFMFDQARQNRDRLRRWLVDWLQVREDHLLALSLLREEKLDAYDTLCSEVIDKYEFSP